VRPLRITPLGSPRYTPCERPWIPFHVDSSALTINVALCDDADFDGGKLVVLCGGAVQRLDRREGEATVHASTLLHGVSRLRAGRRYSLVLFYGRKPRKGWTAVERRTEVTVLAGLWRDGDARSQCYSVLPRGCLENPVVDSLLLRSEHGAGSDDNLDEVGALIEEVVVRYGAPHLLPSTIARRRAEALGDSGWCYSLRALLSYIAAVLARPIRAV
jgi:hypothetical protein